MGRRRTGLVSLMPSGLGTSPQPRPQAHPTCGAQWSAKGQVWTSQSWVQVLALLFASHVMLDKSLSLSGYAQPQVDQFLFWEASPRSPATDRGSRHESLQRWTSELNRKQAQATGAVCIVTHAHTGAMSPGLRLNILLWLLLHAKSVWFKTTWSPG